MQTNLIDPNLDGKHVLITGANNPQGIGAATAKGFARLGCAVFVHYFREPAPSVEPGDTPGAAFHQDLRSRMAQKVVEEIMRAGGKASSWESDLATPGSARELFDQAESSFGPVHVLINNAAHCGYDTFLPQGEPVYGEESSEQAVPLTPESHDRHFAINSRATALLMAEFARRHVGRDAVWGRIVNISTDASSAHPGAVSYGASKHALESYSRAAAWELGRFGITVNIIAPGPVQTGWLGPRLEAQAAQRIPLGRIGTPNDIADVAVFLASGQARWITGQTLYVGGGNVMPL